MNRQLRQRLLTEYPDWHKNPLLLSKKEIKNPHKVVAEFFDCYDLPGIRACLKEWLLASLRPEEILQMNFPVLHDHIIKLAEAAWLLYAPKPHGSGKKHKKSG